MAINMTVIKISRVGLPGGRATEVEVSGEAAVERIRNSVAQTLGKAEVEIGVPLVGMKNIVQAIVPCKGNDENILIIKVAHGSPSIEVARCSATAICNPEVHDVKIYRSTADCAMKLHRMLLTEFMLKDSNAGHPMSSFTLPAGMAQAN
eukprot:TRINITY_DN15259_c0_g1_i1.p1 TRINITY_DN15259_c0_g1~~TRINITY_DN15259_c0_g1_i1.p1  ORF type:complete len:149 (+),score=5.82 TRINITY_DN15259_c0_g1_i1:68-514(+)